MRIATIRRAGASAVARAASLRVVIREPADAAPDPELRLAELARSRLRPPGSDRGGLAATRADQCSSRLNFIRCGWSASVPSRRWRSAS
jgi:hypothetical protein